MQRREAEIGLRDRKCHQRPEERNNTGENPPETARFESVWKCAVLKDWMVETEGTELPTPHPVIEPVSDIRVRNGNFRCRDGSVKTAVPPLRDR